MRKNYIKPESCYMYVQMDSLVCQSITGGDNGDGRPAGAPGMTWDFDDFWSY